MLEAALLDVCNQGRREVPLRGARESGGGASVIAYALTFASGFTVECVSVFWVHFSERGRPLATALCSMAIGTAQVFGIGESVRDWHFGPAFVAGYGCGTAAAVWLKGRAAGVRA